MSERPISPAVQRRVSVDGIELSLAEYVASGPPLVLLHGIGSRGVSWWPVVDALAAHFRLFVPDLRGHGDSDKPAAGYQIADYAADLAALIDALEISRPLILGHSLGGIITLAWAVCHPDCAERIALEDVPLRGGSRDAPLYDDWLALASMAILLGLVFVLLRSRLGASLQAIRDDEEAAKSIGVHVLRAKLVVFTLAAVGCGAAGAVWLADQLTYQPNSYFGVQWTAYMIFMVLVGGLGTFEGPIIGAVIFFVVQDQFGEEGVWYLIALGTAAIAFALLLPRGLWGTLEERFGVRLLPVGYRLRGQLVRSPRPQAPVAERGATG